MTKKTRDTICKLAQRMLAVQLEADPHTKSNTSFYYREWCTYVFWDVKAAPEQWSCEAWRPMPAGTEEVKIPL